MDRPPFLAPLAPLACCCAAAQDFGHGGDLAPSPTFVVRGKKLVGFAWAMPSPARRAATEGLGLTQASVEPAVQRLYGVMRGRRMV